MRRLALLILAALITVPIAALAQSIQVSDLRCEYLQNPLGLHEMRPRLSWVIDSHQRGQRQTAYQVLVASTLANLEQDRGDVWDSGKVASDETTHVAYAGKEQLQSGQACHWKVRSWDRDGKPSSWSKPASWEMGLLFPCDWYANWIEGDLRADADRAVTLAGAKWIWCPQPGVDLQRSAPAGDRLFRCRLTIPHDSKPFRAAMIISVDDQFALYVNGKLVANFAERDGWKRPQQFDLLPYLTSGENVVAVIGTNIEAQAGLCAKIVVQYSGKAAQIITSDRHWKTASDNSTAA